MQDLKFYKEEFEKAITHLQEELNGIRTGRAHISVVENISVDCYGAMTPLKGLASISIPDARTILVTPWDTSIIKEIEKALAASTLGAHPVNEGTSIRIVLPQLTEENRIALAKVVGQKQEHAKVSLRLVRDKIREEIQKGEKNKEITEDDRFVLQKDLDEMTKTYTARADALAGEKEQEVMSI
ncbi:ribosome recycling factor [Candidatus Uhrbacteria bacterium]|nr:ribosome recycling factor [Candidatus Uhrbacteria bacterium]